MKIKRSHYAEGFIVYCISERQLQNEKIYRSSIAIGIAQIADWKCKFSFFRHMLNKQKHQMIYAIGEDSK